MSTITTPTSDTLDPAFFAVTPHMDVLSRMMMLQNCNGRFPIAHTKGRSERTGSTRKLFKQKGTGNARVGSSRSPVRRGG